MSLKLNYQLMKSTEVNATLDRMAGEILEANNGRPVVLIGIQRRGVPMARRIAVRMAEKIQREPQIGTLDINLYRDDLTRVASQPVVQKTEVPPDIDDRDVVLVDAEIFTTSADSRFPAISNDVRVRVDASKKRLITVLPRKVGTFFMGLVETS